MERSVGEAVLHMASDTERLNAFQDWLHLVFGGGRELAFLFPRITKSEIEKFLNRKDKEEYKEGYNTFHPAELSNEMLDDFKILLYEYKAALKKNNNATKQL